jgi:alkylation response protein AidB-like acyl-CoA dehydrogenase
VNIRQFFVKKNYCGEKILLEDTMAVFKTDLEDIYFNLFKDLNVAELAPDLGEDGIKDVIGQFDKFVGAEIFPNRTKADEEGVSLVDGQVKVPECYKKAKNSFYDNGWFALGQPEDIGGMPVPEVVSLACTSISTGADTSFGMYPGLTKAALNVIRLVGTQEQIDQYIPSMMEGKWGGTMCLTEAGAGSDVGALRSTAKPLDNGRHLISGTKIFISSGDNDLYDNIVHLVLARTPEGQPGTKGISLFIVPKYKIGADGSVGESNDVVCSKVEEKMGIHSQATCELQFGANGNCEGWLIGEEFDGMTNMFIMMNEARLLCAIQGEGQSSLAYSLTKQYVEERVQFGTEIGNHPDVKKNMLKMRAMCRGIRSLIYYTSHLFDSKEESAEAEVALLTPLCKAYCTDEAMLIASNAIQMHGGYGYCSEYGIEQFLRDIKISAIYEGTNAIQATDYVMRKILKDGGAAFQSLGSKIQKTLSNPVAANWEKEVASMGASMQKAVEILGVFGEKAKAKDYNGVLQHCCEFLSFSGNLIVAWRLLEHAIIAHESIDSAADAEKKYLSTKVDDFRVFCQYYLVNNISLSKLITGCDLDVASLEL